jgi:hypothetical protein
MVLVGEICRMLTYQRIQGNPRHFKSLTSLDVSTFERLFSHFDSVVDQYLTHFTLSGKVRQRRPTITTDSVFQTRQDMLLFILMYLKNNPLQDYHASQFGITQPQANRWIHLTLDWLWETLARLKELPARSDQALNQLLATQLEVLLDGTERAINRSTDYETQKEHYSGKKNSIR